jgi:hypothetical protein
LKRGTRRRHRFFATQLPALEIPEQIWVLFSDTHIAEDETLVARGACMAENLRRCANQVLKIGQKPFGLIVNGDCAYLEGISEDYVTFAALHAAAARAVDPGSLHARQPRPPHQLPQRRHRSAPAERRAPHERAGQARRHRHQRPGELDPARLARPREQNARPSR